MTERTHVLLTRTAALVAIGALAWALVRRSSGGWTAPGLVLAGLVVVLGAIEVAAVRSTNRRHPVASWLPTAVGLAAAIAIDDRTGPTAPDAGLARSMAVGMVIVATAAMAMGVHLIAGIARVAGWTPSAK